MGVYESYANIKKAVKDMDIVWERTRQVWKDARSRQFEKEFMERLSVEVRKAEIALDTIGPILNRIHSELKE